MRLADRDVMETLSKGVPNWSKCGLNVVLWVRVGAFLSIEQTQSAKMPTQMSGRAQFIYQMIAVV